MDLMHKYDIEGLTYVLPKQPPLHTMRNYGLPKIKQVWTRRTEYEELDWSEGWEDRVRAGNADQEVKYISEEIDRLHNGEWIIIEGKPVYLNNHIYFFHQWFVLEDDIYPDFRDTTIYYYRFLELVDGIRMCAGHTLLKGRRLGATSMIMSRILLKMLLKRNKNFGIVSKTGEDAQGAFDFLVMGFQSLPVFLKPQTEGTDSPKKTLYLKQQASRIKKGQSTSGERKGFNNKANWKSTKLNSYDSGAYEEILVDESGKFPPETPIDDYLPIVVKCVKKGVVVTGKLSLPTTVNPPDKGGSGYRTVWNNSDQTKADKYGQTKSMLYRIQIPGYYGQLGYMDRYGNSVVENPTPEQVAWLTQDEDCPDPTIGAKTFQAHHRKMLENDQDALQEAKRLDPWSAEEVFETANESCIFDMPSLVAQETKLVEMLDEQGLNTEKDELGRRGWFHKMPNGRVKFFDDKDGLCYVYKLLPEEESNKFVIGKEGQTPTNEELGAAGLDPVASGQPTVEKGSDACMIIRSRYSSMDPENTGTVMSMFLGRMKSTRKFHEQIFNMLQYYGVKMLGERAPSNWIDYASDQEPKLLGYLYGTKQSDGTERKGIPPGNTKSLIEEHADAQVLASLADHDKIPCLRLIRDRMSFRVSERTLYDACMADGYANMALRIPFKKDVHKKVKIKLFSGGKVHEYH